MCNVNGNRELVCTVGDLKPGEHYRDPEGHEYLIAEGQLTVRLDNGAVASILDWVPEIGMGCYRKDIKLGRDRQDRLYASRFLNPILDADEAKNQADAAYFNPAPDANITVDPDANLKNLLDNVM